MRQFQEHIRPWEGIPAGLQSNWERRRQAWKRRRQAWEHLGVPGIILGALRITVEQSGKNNIFFGNAAGAPGNHSYYLSFNNFKTHVLSLYSHLCIYVSIYLPIYTRYSWTGCRRCLRASRGAPENDDQVNSGIHTRAVIEWVWGWTLEAVIERVWRWTLQGAIERVWRCTWRPRPSEFGDAIGCRDRVTLETVIEQVLRYTCRLWSSELGDALRGHDLASLEMHLEAVIDWVWRL